MKLIHIAALFVLAMGACTKVSTRSDGAVIVDDRSYALETRTISGSSGTFEQTKVVVYGVPYTCLPDSPGDCEAKVRRALNRYDFF